MTLIPNPEAVQNFPRNFELEIPDETGLYSIENPGGWDSTNAVNPDYDDITEVHLRMIHSNGLDATVQINNNAIPWPNATGLSKFVSSEDFGLSAGTNFSDGKATLIYHYIGYNYVGGSEPAETGLLAIVTKTIFLYGNVRCCVQKMLTAAYLEEPHPDCHSEAWKLYREGRALLDGLEDAIACKNYDRAQVILEELETLCLTNNLHCGC